MMMRWLVLPLALAGLGALAAVACTDGDGTVAPTATAEPPGTETTPDGTPAAGGSCLPGEARAPVLAACQALAEQLEASPGEVELVSATPQEWPDSCLGAAAAGEVCAQVITPGFEVVLTVTSAPGTFLYHTDEGTNVRLAGIDVGRPDDETASPEPE